MLAKDDTAAYVDTNDTQKSVGSAANNKASRKTTGAMHLQLQFQMEAIVLIKDMLNVTNTDDHQAKTKSAQQEKLIKLNNN